MLDGSHYGRLGEQQGAILPKAAIYRSRGNQGRYFGIGGGYLAN
ncbi:hypothetical protein ACYEXS_21565 [Paenibacillus sp. MAH-36]|nr:hypothetical protein [Paenibacillus sp. PFR10]